MDYFSQTTEKCYVESSSRLGKTLVVFVLNIKFCLSLLHHRLGQDLKFNIYSYQFITAK
jgi:hypothetical protein